MKRLSVYSDLIKYKLSLAVVLSSVTGYFISGEDISIRLFFLATGVFFLASGAAALNQYSERRTDLLMERTKRRPIPSGEISEKKALLIASFLFISGIVLLFHNGIFPLILGILNVVLYNLVYTLLKRSTVLSIIPGALVGAIPPLIGYSSAGASLASIDIISFSIFMFLWQIPHFWLIIIKYGEEYRKAGLATISSYLNDIQIRKLVFYWVLISSTLLLIFFLVTEIFASHYLILFSILNMAFILLFYRKIFLNTEFQQVRGAMILINTYGLLIMVLLIAGSVIHLF
ncbi:MAG: protoheme IX farnesyltransferase [Bacteroidetes bacterium]|nr:protoheme IX farnesyltransferase [Bacteroidota bacterium]